MNYNIQNFKIQCCACEHPMVFESMSGKNAIYLCELCKHEVKVISIRNKGVSG